MNDKSITSKEKTVNVDQNSISEENTIYEDENVRSVIKVLRDRVKNLRAAAMIAMAFMAISMVGGFAIFYEAGSIVAKENIDSYQRATSIQNSLHATQTEIKMLSTTVRGLDKEKNQEISSKLDQIEKSIASIIPASDKIIEAMPNEQKDKKELNNRISLFSIITRISAGVLLVFLVQVLVKMYRYNVRVAAFYEGRADALQLAANLNSTSIERAAKLLSPDSIDFGEMPEPPTKQAIELVKQIGSLLKKQS